MSRLLSTLALIWRLARPYFVSEDRWAGRILLGAVIAIELSIVAINVMLNQWNNRFYNALQERNWDNFVCELLFFCALAAAFIVLAVYQLYLNQWLQIRWRRWMTRAVSRSLACRRQPLPHAAPGRCRRQPRPAHLRGHQPLHRAHVDAHRRTAQRHRHAGLLRRHPVDALGGCAAASVRHELRHSRLSGLGGAALCDGRNRADAPRRLAAGRRSISASSGSKRTSASTSFACARIPSRSRSCAARPTSASNCSTVSAGWSATSCRSCCAPSS